jgi:hypothetical protein
MSTADDDVESSSNNGKRRLTTAGNTHWPLERFEGTDWTGLNELWLDPLGNNASLSDATMSIEKDKVSYKWTFEQTQHSGSITFSNGGAARFQDSFHMADGVDCKTISGAWGLWQGFFEWSVGNGPAWGWRIALCERETNVLVLQMTIVKPSGEEGRTVRMTLQHKKKPQINA